MSQPIQSPAPSPSPTPKPPRRVPPPCWTHDETLALIESYHEKWYILRRGNLKAVHWQEVADSVARRCRFTIPTKTSIQCRHKIEKLRKRYRTEKQRLSSLPNNNKFSSSWVFFKKMDNMEKGPLSTTAEAAPAVKVKDEDGRDEGEEDEDEDDDENENEEENEDEDYNNTPHHQQTNFHRSVSNGSGSGSGTGTGTLGLGSRVGRERPHLL
ncbi:hypothetical protein IFM89_022577 [Coptis chinensis]|uniref:Myb-like domain-containing protein n=1 Tax=Coptis chinensis TaxID=261450 RepID=A0A835MFP4_9MAGN|nr:hypothetical protein IFM89_022577 [Coptis chinensis]